MTNNLTSDARRAGSAHLFSELGRLLTELRHVLIEAINLATQCDMASASAHLLRQVYVLTLLTLLRAKMTFS